LATIFRDSYSKNLMGGGSLSWAGMRLLLTTFLLLGLLPGTAAAADLTLTLRTADGVQYGTPHEATGRLVEGTTPLAGQAVEIRSRAYPYNGAFTKVATVVTDANGFYELTRRFNRNVELQAVAVAQNAVSRTRRAYVYPRPRSTFKSLSGSRLRITQFLRTPAGVRLSAKTIFYLGPGNAKSAPRVASATPRKIGRGRFKATATVKIPRRWKGAFRYGSCFRYSEGSGLGNPRATCPEKYRF
jgi:hypothetical protein